MSARRPLATAACASLVLGLAGGCPDRPTRQRDPIQEPIPMTRLLRDLPHHPSTAITIQQGTEHFDDGVITLTVRGDGTAAVDQLRAGATQRYAKQLAPDRIAAIGAALADHDLTRARSTKLPRAPGDTPLVLRIDGAGGTSFRADLWYGDRYTDPDLDAILHLADALVHEITGGALGQPMPAPRQSP